VAIHSTSEQKYAICLGIENGGRQKSIASLTGIGPSTLSREIRHNSNKHGRYSWRMAQEMTDERKERSPGNRSVPEWIKHKALGHVRDDDWSPMQVSGRLKRYSFGNISQRGRHSRTIPPGRLKQIQHKLNNRPREKQASAHQKLSFINN